MNKIIKKRKELENLPRSIINNNNFNELINDNKLYRLIQGLINFQDQHIKDIKRYPLQIFKLNDDKKQLLLKKIESSKLHDMIFEYEMPIEHENRVMHCVLLLNEFKKIKKQSVVSLEILKLIQIFIKGYEKVAFFHKKDVSDFINELSTSTTLKRKEFMNEVKQLHNVMMKQSYNFRIIFEPIIKTLSYYKIYSKMNKKYNNFKNIFDELLKITNKQQYWEKKQNAFLEIKTTKPIYSKFIKKNIAHNFINRYNLKSYESEFINKLVDLYIKYYYKFIDKKNTPRNKRAKSLVFGTFIVSFISRNRYFLNYLKFILSQTETKGYIKTIYDDFDDYKETTHIELKSIVHKFDKIDKEITTFENLTNDLAFNRIEMFSVDLFQKLQTKLNEMTNFFLRESEEKKDLFIEWLGVSESNILSKWYDYEYRPDFKSFKYEQYGRFEFQSHELILPMMFLSVGIPHGGSCIDNSIMGFVGSSWVNPKIFDKLDVAVSKKSHFEMHTQSLRPCSRYSDCPLDKTLDAKDTFLILSMTALYRQIQYNDTHFDFHKIMTLQFIKKVFQKITKSEDEQHDLIFSILSRTHDSCSL